MKLVDRIKGVFDYILKPALRHQWGGPFNGQRFRQKIFFDILQAIPVKHIIETGTFLGSTTELFAATSLPVYSVERSDRAYAYSCVRLWGSRSTVKLACMDSREFLKTGFANGALPKSDVFFYLDAHWGRRNLPLLEELQILFESCQSAVVMIDDFCVPGTSYSFDSYGPKRTLNLDYIKPVVEQYQLAVYFPSVPAESETGGKAGCAVLCRKEEAQRMDERVTSLKRYA